MKNIEFEYGDKPYKLEFTRKSIEKMEKEGFTITDIEHKPLTVLPALFAGAFKANHEFTSRKIIDEIYDNFTDKKELINKLADMYKDAFETLFSEPETEKKIMWKANW